MIMNQHTRLRLASIERLIAEATAASDPLSVREVLLRDDQVRVADLLAVAVRAEAIVKSGDGSWTSPLGEPWVQIADLLNNLASDVTTNANSI